MRKTPEKRPRPAGRRPRFKAAEFYSAHPVFRFDEFLRAHTAAGRSPETSAALLRNHVASGQLRNLRRGLYATLGGEGIDPWLVGSRLAEDAVLAYDGALSFHGLTGLGHGMSLFTQERVSRFVFAEVVYRAVPPPAALAKEREWGGGIIKTERDGLELRVTTRERALVDVVDRLDLAPFEENLFDLFLAAGDLDVGFMVRYVRALGNALAAARLGCLLEHRPGVSPAHLLAIERLRPSGPAYFDRRHRNRGDTFLSRWNLVVPRDLFDQGRRRPSED
jgi:predicted transcriptional regulator of viral defense system